MWIAARSKICKQQTSTVHLILYLTAHKQTDTLLSAADHFCRLKWEHLYYSASKFKLFILQCYSCFL